MPLLCISTEVWRDFLLILGLIKLCKLFLDNLNCLKKNTALRYFKTEAITHTSTQFLIDEGEPMQTEPLYLSSDEDSMSEYPMSEQFFPADDDALFQSLNHFVIHPDDPTDAAQVTISSYDNEMTQLSSSATTNLKLQSNKHTQNVSPATINNFFQSGPHFYEFGQLSAEIHSHELPMPSNWGSTNLFRPYDF